MPAPFHLPRPALDTFGEAELLDVDDRAAHILRMRSGIWDGERHTLSAIGEELGIEKERVRQLQNQGLLVILQVREVQRHLRREPSVRAHYRWRTPR